MPAVALLTDVPLGVRTYGPVTLSGTRKVDQLIVALSVAFPPVDGCVLEGAFDWRPDAQADWLTVLPFQFVGVWPLPPTTLSGAAPENTYGVSFGGHVRNVAGAQIQARVTQMTGGVWTASLTVTH